MNFFKIICRKIKQTSYVCTYFCNCVLYNFVEHFYTLKNDPVKLQKHENLKRFFFVLNEKDPFGLYCRFKYFPYAIFFGRVTNNGRIFYFCIFSMKYTFFGILSTSQNRASNST